MVSKDHSTDGSGSQTCQLQNLTIFWTGVDFFYFRDRVNNVFTEPVRNYISPMMFTDPKSEMTENSSIFVKSGVPHVNVNTLPTFKPFRAIF